MNRCTPTSSLSSSLRRTLCKSVLLAAVTSAALHVAAQGLPSNDTRNFPPQAQFGELVVNNFPEVKVNGQTVRTTPGFRLFTPERSLVFANNYAGQKLVVAYVIEPQTQGLHTAWILTAAEIEKYKPIKGGFLRALFGQ